MTHQIEKKRENSVKEASSAAAPAGVATANEETTLWTLLLTAPGQPRMILEQIPNTCTVSSLYERAQQAVHDNTTAAADAATTVTIGSLKAGFPPRVLSRSDETTLVEAGLCHQDRIVVELETVKPNTTTKAAAAKASKSVPATTGSTCTSSAVTTSKRSSKRAAAAAATASFAETIRAQEEAAAQLALSSLSSSSSSSRNKRNASVSLRTAAKPTSSPQKTRFAASATTGRRLNDGAVIAPKVAKSASSSPRKRRRDDSWSAPAPASDPGVALLEALSSTSSKGARLMRQGWRHAVRDAEEQSRSLSRLAAITAGVVQYSTTTATTTERDKETETMELNAPLQQLLVTYPKGIQGRGTYTDSVDYLPLDVLQSVIQGIHPVNPEALRPENLALLSPRVLWSLVYHAHHSSNGNQGNQKSTSVASALQAVAPTLDWSFLRRRREQLSEKALENLRQQQQAQAERAGTTAVGEDWEAAARAIESVEHAMEELHTRQKLQQQAQLARAAQQRMERNQNKKEEDSSMWTIMTPTEFDEDELRDCILAGQSKTENIDREFFIISLGSEEAAQVKIPLNDVIQWLAKDCEIRNWRELANADVEQVTEALLQKFSIQAPNQRSKDMQKAMVSLVDSWIDFAQIESLGEIMVEICQGNVDTVDLLTRAANSGTPKDLAAWKSIAEILHDVLEEFAAKHNDIGPKVVPSVDEIKMLCNRSQQALDQFEWLHWFATPVEDAS